MAVLEGLQADHDDELFTLTRPDFAELIRYFNTTVEPIPVR